MLYLSIIVGVKVGRVKIKLIIGLAVCAILCAPARANAQVAAFAYSKGHTLFVADGQGRTLRTLTVAKGIGDFTVDHHGRHVVVQTPGDYGGQLLFCTVASGHCTRLTHGWYFYKPDKEGKEVYASPSFSPDGSRITFSIRWQFRKPDGVKVVEEDVIEAEGPIAILSLPSKKVRVLKSTAGDDGCFTDNPMWSHDGSKILFRCEDAGEIVRVVSDQLLKIDDAMEGPPEDKQMDMSLSWPLTWDGPNAILFSRIPAFGGKVEVNKGVVLQLDLKTMRVRKVREYGGLPASELRGVFEIQMSKQLLYVSSLGLGERVYDRHTGRIVWSVGPTQNVPVQLIGRSD
jgi:hypothetical protein